MSLDTWEVADRIYLTRGAEVSVHRPLFTGDVLDDVAIPGVQTGGTAMVVAHPCAMRRGAVLVEHMLAAAVRPHQVVPARKWSEGYYDKMPLPELRGVGTPFEVGRLSEIGLAGTAAMLSATRLACLSPYGVNILQQRTVFNLTRTEVPTAVFWEAFAHTYEEADLLEEWTEELSDVVADGAVVTEFDRWIRADSRQPRLQDPQQRASIRSEMRTEIRLRHRG